MLDGPDPTQTGRIATERQLAPLRARTVAVVYGGCSAEREVSLVSGRTVSAALRAAHGALGAPASVLDVEIDLEGRWHVQGERLAAPEALSRLPRDVLFFLGLHGGDGEDGTLQGFLDVAQRRYTGSGPAASALCMDKRATRALCAEVGLRVSPGAWFPRERWCAERDAVLREARERAGGEAVVKPNSGGSSVDTARVTTTEELARALDTVFEHGDEALVEGWVHGLEATVGVVGNRGAELRALPVVEIRPKPGRFFDYDEKYSADGALETCPPRELGLEAVEALNEAALRSYRTLGCDGYARVDFIVPTDGGAPVLLELNTLPGFTPRSLLPQAAAAARIPFAELCLGICALALARGTP